MSLAMKSYKLINKREVVSMPSELVLKYWLIYKPYTQTARILVRTAESGWQVVDELPPEKAVYVADMLRNEKPVYWVTGNLGLHTKEEPPGEEEISLAEIE